FGIENRRYSRLPRRCREDYDLPDPWRRAALDSRARREDSRLVPGHLNRPNVAAVEVAAVCDVEEPVARRVESRRSLLATGWGERSRLATLGRYSIEPGPVIVLPGEHEEVFRSPLHGPQLHVLRVPGSAVGGPECRMCLAGVRLGDPDFEPRRGFRIEGRFHRVGRHAKKG